MNKSLSILVLLMLTTISFSQETNSTQKVFNKTELETWKELISASSKIYERNYFDVLFYNINVEVSIDTTFIIGNVNCRFKITQDNTSFIVVDLHHALKVDSINGNAGNFEVTGDSIKIFLDQVYNSNDICEINVFYKGVPELAEETKGLVYETHGNNEPVIASLSTPFLAHYWWPCKDGPSDKADSVYINITIPDTTINGIPVIAVSNGVLENTITEDGKKTFQWRERYPIVTYYVMVAISNYRTLQNNYEPSVGKSFPLEYYVFNEHITDAELGVEELPEVIDLYSEYFGNYPFENEKYAMTQLGFYGAIENQTNTIIYDMALSSFSTTVHELAHMWFGDMITCKSWHHGWLNEGFATYCEALWEESKNGVDGYKATIEDFSYYTTQYLSDQKLYLENDTDPFGIFVGIIYYKGAVLLHMLRGVLGDEVFFECLKQYATNPDYMYGYVETSDFQNICEKVSGTDLDFFFDQWVYEAGHPVYEFGYSSRQENTEYIIDLKINQVQETGTIFEMPIELVVEYDDGTEEIFSVWDSTASQQTEIVVSKQPANVIFDPNNWILKEVTEILFNPTLDQGVLLVNGLVWNEDIKNSYSSKAYWGNLPISFWDLENEPNNGYPAELPAVIKNGEISPGIFGNYSTVIWVSSGNDILEFNNKLIKQYLDYGGNIILLTNSAKKFLDDDLKNYAGIEWNSSLYSTLVDFKSTVEYLSDISVTNNQAFINTLDISPTSETTTLLYQSTEGFDSPRGTAIISKPVGKGTFCLFTCKPYLFNYAELSSNIEYIVRNIIQDPATEVEEKEAVNLDFSLNNLYPNPFNPSTNIEFSIPVSELVKITAYNITGERVDEIVDENFNAGVYNIKWNASSLPSGVYFIRLSAGRYSAVQKAIVLK